MSSARDYYGADNDWTQVRYRRGRLKPHTEHRGGEFLPRHRRQPQGSRPRYASITGGKQRHDGDSPSRQFYRHGYGWRPFIAQPGNASHSSRRNAAPRDFQNQRAADEGIRHAHNGNILPQVRVTSDDPDFTLKVRVVYRRPPLTTQLSCF